MGMPPSAPFVAVTPHSPTNNTKPTWTWMSGSSGGSGVFRYRLDSSDLSQNAITGIQSSFTPVQALSEGTHVLYVQERGGAGDWSMSGSAEVLIDVTPPSAPMFLSVPRSPLNSVMPTWKWMSGGGGDGTYRYKIDDATVDVGANTVMAVEFTPLGELTEGLHTMFLQERDAALNWSPSSSRALVLAKRGSLGGPDFRPEAPTGSQSGSMPLECCMPLSVMTV
jgi:hypothetical protein